MRSPLLSLSLLSVPPSLALYHQIPLVSTSGNVNIASPHAALPYSDLNIISTTDTHGWLRGHLSEVEASYSGTLGDLYSFVHHMKQKARDNGQDLLFVDSGDTVDGNGLVDADTSGIKGKFARTQLAQMPYDLITTGNHEGYNFTITKDVIDNFIPKFGGNYITSNVFIGNQPMGSLYRTFKTEQGKTVTAFGVLFNFLRADGGMRIQSVGNMVFEDWFQQAVSSNDTDVFVLVGHMAASDEDWDIVVHSIREHHPSKPILIFAGHAHIRDCRLPDENSIILASGRYMETVGFTSLNFTSGQIERRYLDANRVTYKYHLNMTNDEFDTVTGSNITTSLTQAAASFNLSATFGYAPHSYFLDRLPFTSPYSLPNFLVNQVFPYIISAYPAPSVQNSSTPQLFVLNAGCGRFDLFKGTFTVDDQLSILPFSNKIVGIPKVPSALAQKVVDKMNEVGEAIVDSQQAHDEVELMNTRDLRASKYAALAGPEIFSEKLTFGYVTKDQCNGKGDDTLHRPLPVNRTPWFMTSTVDFSSSEVVDVVFLDFITPLVIQAFHLLGADNYTKEDVILYATQDSNQVLGTYAQKFWNKIPGDDQ